MSAPDPIPIFQGQDFYVPYFEVKVGDKPLGRETIRDIIQVSYKDNLKDIDSFEITINNWDAAKLRFKYSDGNLFLPGKKAELWMGYYGKDRYRLMLTGEITSLRPSFPAGGQPTLVVGGLNLLHQFRKKQRSYAYRDLTDTGIARLIAKEVGAELKPAPKAANEEKFPYLLQDNQYDIVFLMERARRIGYDLFVEEGGNKGKAAKPLLYFGPSENVKKKTYELFYGKSLIEFSPELTTAKQVNEVVVRGWSTTKKQVIEGKATRADLETKGLGKKGGQDEIASAFNEKKEVVADRPIANEKEAKQLAINTLRSIANDMVKGNGSTLGLPDLRTGNVVVIGGLGSRFSGRYFVTGTTHSISHGGYTTQFECRREELAGGAA